MPRTNPADMKVLAVVQKELGDLLESLDGPRRFDLVRRVASLVERQVGLERSRIAGLCRGRAELWERTLAGKSGAPPVARDEARARSNEAIHLADLLDAGEAALPSGDDRG